jgi:hypothetical protein
MTGRFLRLSSPVTNVTREVYMTQSPTRAHARGKGLRRAAGGDAVTAYVLTGGTANPRHRGCSLGPGDWVGDLG